MSERKTEWAPLIPQSTSRKHLGVHVRDCHHEPLFSKTRVLDSPEDRTARGIIEVFHVSRSVVCHAQLRQLHMTKE